MAKLIKTDGTEQEVYPLDKEYGFSLEELYELIGCDIIEAIRLKNNSIVVIDEEGWFKKDIEINWNATSKVFGRKPTVTNIRPILGNVVVCNDKEFQ